MKRGFTPTPMSNKLKAVSRKSQLVRGFTLMELIVYIGILALIGVASVRLILSVAFNAAEVKAERALTASAEVAVETLTREIRQAYDFDLGGSVFGQNPSTLVLKTYVTPESSATTTRTFYLSSSRLARQDAGTAPEFITSGDVKITGLTFWRLSTTTSSLITVKISLEAGEGRFKESQNFYDSAVLRAKY